MRLQKELRMLIDVGGRSRWTLMDEAGDGPVGDRLQIVPSLLIGFWATLSQGLPVAEQAIHEQWLSSCGDV